MRIGQSLGRSHTPRQGAVTARGQRGFSILELMVVLIIIGVAVAIAAPAFAKWRSRQAVNSAAQSLVSHMKQARALALAENRNVSITFGSASYTFDADTTGTCGLCKPQTVSYSTFSSQLTVSPTTTRTFASIGTVNNGTITLTAGSSSRDVVLNIIGRAYLK